MEFTLRFVITQDTSQRFGIDVVAVAPDGTQIGQPAQVHDRVFSTAAEAAERIVMGVRGTFRTLVPGHFPADFIFTGR